MPIRTPDRIAVAIIAIAILAVSCAGIPPSETHSMPTLKIDAVSIQILDQHASHLDFRVTLLNSGTRPADATSVSAILTVDGQSMQTISMPLDATRILPGSELASLGQFAIDARV
ncbi:MAG: hypothetical protein E4H20_05165, partial [Spirochaetales bacterium]